MTDAELVARAQGGDAGAFRTLVLRWEGSLFGFACRLLGNREEAQDVCQEAFLKAHQRLTSLRNGAKFRSWLHSITLNLCRDRGRTAHAKAHFVPWETREETTVAEVGQDRARIVPAADKGAETAGLSAVLESVLRDLSEEQRESILLREYQGLTSEEVGEVLGVPAATVRTRIYYGLRSLREALEKQGLMQEDLL